MRACVFLGLVGALFAGHASWASDLTAYFPSDTGRSWRYSTAKHSTLSAGSETRNSDKQGTVAEKVRGASSVGTVAISRIVTEENSTMGNVRVESALHVQVQPDTIAVTAFEIPSDPTAALQRLSPAQPLLLGSLPGPTIEGSQGSLRLITQLKSQSPSNTEVPLGKFSDCILTETAGSVSGSLNGSPVQAGSIVIKAWYARGIGLVREERTLRFTVAAPNGAPIEVQEVATKVLEESKSP